MSHQWARRIWFAVLLLLLVAGLVPRNQQATALASDSQPRIVLDHGYHTLIYPPGGYTLAVPAELDFDLRLAPAFVRASSDRLDVKISRERSPYGDVKGYLRDYPNRFLVWPEYEPYLHLNRMTVLENLWTEVNGCPTWILRYRREPAPGSPETQNEYQTAYVLTGGLEFYTFTFRTDSLAENQATIDAVLGSFGKIPTRGAPAFAVNFRPVPADWNAETRALFDRLQTSKEIMWGIFYPHAVRNDYSKVAEVEQKLDFNFPILMGYMYLDEEFPMEGMRRAHDRGQVVELTLQVARGHNDNEPRSNANFDLLDGLYDERIRTLAREIKAFGHPILFRVNNEMNTDWSQYSGVLTLGDPDLYIKNWQRIYRIFREEGVQNTIWIFNPHDRSYPPMNWNSHISYYPGNGYVHMLGITGYNNGTGLKEVTGETWRSFREIYQPMAEEYRPIYSRFPWIITEFASSSIGGDKAAWIAEMYRELPNFPEIKAAVWFHYGDKDYRPGRTHIWARPYFLDDKPEYLEAFRAGLPRK